MLRISGIKLGLDEDMKIIPKKIQKKLKLKGNQIRSFSIHKESIDARKEEIRFIYTVDVEFEDEAAVLKENHDNQIIQTPNETYSYVEQGKEALTGRPVIVGFGPCGMFAALILSEMGYRPLIIEQGKKVEERVKDVSVFWEKGILNAESNVQFGEGGAGTFSDGKLTTRIKDTIRCKKVLETFILSGAPKDILYKQKPHLGTDILRLIVKNIRKRIINLGGEILFNEKLTDIHIKDGQVQGVVINHKNSIKTNTVILALGHSARDTFEMLFEKGIEIKQKPFSVGVRIEHPQSIVDKAQFGKYKGHPRLGAADYKLVHHCKNGRGAYTFCMCPGGVVVASASEKNGVVTNGMSYFKRDGKNANSALLIDIKPDDFNSEHPLAGIQFQRQWEKKAWTLAGEKYNAPAQKVGDFLRGQATENQGSVEPTYLPGVYWTDITKCLPEYVVTSMKEAIPEMAKKLKGFDMDDAVMTAIETRSSSPIRIVRDDVMQSNIKGLYPAGEGAGYAGGIISAAVDGIKVAESLASQFYSC